MVSFADVAHQLVSFDPSEPIGELALKIIDTSWLQRLRDISQTANTRLVYMFSEHSRFGHTLGVAHLANLVLTSLKKEFPKQVNEYGTAIIAAALLHDVGHIAPGSHTAWGTFFPGQPDEHEDVGLKVTIEAFLNSSDPTFKKWKSTLEKTVKILEESDDVPPWTWQIISGGGWNADRGNWCIVDSILAGVSYGRYNIEALIESFTLSPKLELVVHENRLDALAHFAVSRHAMYEQLYQHRVILASECINANIIKRARVLGVDNLPFCDKTMARVMNAKSAHTLSIKDIFVMRESWWKYHVTRWSTSGDTILADLCDRHLNRRLFKTIRIDPKDLKKSKGTFTECVEYAGFDPEYYLHTISNKDTHQGDIKSSMRVLMDDGSVSPFEEVAPLFKALVRHTYQPRAWIVLPKEAKDRSGKRR